MLDSFNVARGEKACEHGSVRNANAEGKLAHAFGRGGGEPQDSAGNARARRVKVTI
jgi:hypothetical protein